MTVEQIVEVLNDAFKTDPAAIDALIMNAVPCNKAMLDHKTINVRAKNMQGDFPVVGFLGILNAVADVDGKVIMAVFDEDTRCLIRFDSKALDESLNDLPTPVPVGTSCLPIKLPEAE